MNADQLAVLCMGATYYSRPDDPAPVLAPFGSGCMQLTTLFTDPDIPQAVIGATDHSLRRFLEPWMLAFTVTRPMFELLCRWGDDPQELAPFRVHRLAHPRPGRLPAVVIA